MQVTLVYEVVVERDSAGAVQDKVSYAISDGKIVGDVTIVIREPVISISMHHKKQ